MNIRHWMAAAGVALCAASAIAAGGGGGGAGGGGGGGGGGEASASADPDFRIGFQAWKDKQWPQVVASMGAVVGHDPDNADAWNYRAYAYRQMGSMDDAFKDYERALQINPKHRGAHEYLGEAYLLVGNLPKAEEHLKVLDKLCFLPCEEYSELKEKVADYRKDHPPLASK